MNPSSPKPIWQIILAVLFFVALILIAWFVFNLHEMYRAGELHPTHELPRLIQ